MMLTTTMSMRLTGAFAVLAAVGVDAVCNVDEHHPFNGGYHIEGVNGQNGESHPDFAYLGGHTPWPNATWATGLEYEDGSVKICTGPFCSETCATQGCAEVLYGTTCSQIRFCYEEDSGSDVWMLPNEVSMANCDFSEAEQICDTTEGSGENCCNFVVEEDAALGVHFFASRNGCAQGQRVAVEIDDYDVTGDQCYAMGLTSSRINSCTCRDVSSLSEPCHSQFIKGCFANFPDLTDDDSCCETGTCIGNHQDIDHTTGKAMEEERVLLCQDNIPGSCVIDGVADCCTKTCTECGIAMGPFVEWATCTAGNYENATAECGFGHGTFEPQVCDFTQCDPTHLWHHESDKLQAWLQTFATDDSETAYCPNEGNCGTGGCYDMQGTIGNMGPHACVCQENSCNEDRCGAVGGIWADGCGTYCNPVWCDDNPPPGPVSFIDAANATGNYNKLLGLIEDTGAFGLIENVLPVTVFGPNDAAFDAVAQILEGLDSESVLGVLAMHTVALSEARAADVVSQGCVELQTLGETMLKISYNEADGTVMINDVAKVVEADIGDKGSMGVLHGIDAVILDPESFTPCSTPADAPTNDAPPIAPTDAPVDAPADDEEDKDKDDHAGHDHDHDEHKGDDKDKEDKDKVDTDNKTDGTDSNAEDSAANGLWSPFRLASVAASVSLCLALIY